MNTVNNTPLRHPTNHALRIMAYLTDKNRLVPVRRIKADLGISMSHVEHILATLGKSKLVQSKRGPSGGYQIATWMAKREDPAPINAWDVCVAMQPEVALVAITSAWHADSIHTALETALRSVRYTQ